MKDIRFLCDVCGRVTALRGSYAFRPTVGETPVQTIESAQSERANAPIHICNGCAIEIKATVESGQTEAPHAKK